jgi:hypothetical protein
MLLVGASNLVFFLRFPFLDPGSFVGGGGGGASRQGAASCNCNQIYASLLGALGRSAAGPPPSASECQCECGAGTVLHSADCLRAAQQSLG